MIRRLDRLYAKHPRLSFAGMLIACAIALYVARDLDADNTAALRLQMFATRQRGST